MEFYCKMHGLLAVALIDGAYSGICKRKRVRSCSMPLGTEMQLLDSRGRFTWIQMLIIVMVMILKTGKCWNEKCDCGRGSSWMVKLSLKKREM